MFSTKVRSPDIAVADGRTAASSLGAVLAQAGLDLVVIEREAESRDRVRGEALEAWE